MATFDPNNPESISRLNSAIDESITGLESYRKNYNHLRKALSDPCHIDRPRIEYRQVVSKLDEFFTILTRACVSRNPTLRIARTKFPRNAQMLKTQLEAWCVRHDFASILRDGFHEGLLRWCVAYMSHYQHGDSIYPTCTILDFEDYFIDLRQSDEALIDFEGHEYDVFREELEDPKQGYDQEAVAALGAGQKSTAEFGRRPLYDRVRLRCCWLPRHRLILTLPATGGNKALRVIQYKGPPDGPYVRMSFTKRRGAIVPTSRASFLLDLHDFCAVTQRQVFMQADQFCEFFLTDSQFEQAADIHRTAEYGQYYTVDNVNAVQRVTKGGVNQGTLLASMTASDMFNERAGNLRLLAGQSTGEPTARQANQLGFGVDAMVRDCRSALNKFAKRILEQVSFYMLYLDTNSPPKQVEWTDEAGHTAPSWWIPEQVAAEVPNGDPQLEIIPDSMIERSSEEQAASLLDSVRTIAQLMAVPGNRPVFLDHQEITDQLKELRNQPELSKIFGEAPDANSIVPGSDTAGALQGPDQGQQQVQPPPNPNDQMRQKLMYQQPQPAGAQGGGY